MCQYIVLHATMNVFTWYDVLCCHNIHVEATVTCISDRQ